MSATLSLREALAGSISSGRFEDTKIILYSRRDLFGNVCQPRALYASSHILKTVPYFNDLPPGSFAEAEPKDFSEPVDDGGAAEDYGYYSDSDLEDDGDDNVVYPVEPLEKAPPRDQRQSSVDRASSSTKDNKSPLAYGEHKERLQQGKVIKVQDVAYITFQAFLLYLYTGHIEFAPCGSEESRKSRVAEKFCTSDDTIPRPSPKSIYRLADKYDVPALKKLAWGSILHGLNECDIVEEAFGQFASKYQAVRSLQVNRLASLWFNGDETSTQSIGERVDEKIDSYVNGELNHAMEAMTLLWQYSRHSVDIDSSYPEDTLVTTPRVASSNDWGPLTIALIKSIREGLFFDKKYWVRDVKTARALRPIYFSSIVSGEKSQRISSLVKLHRKGEYPNAGDASEDSDYQDSSERVGGLEAQNDRKEKVDRELLPVLTVGSFTSWSALFFYLCTETIQFAPLESQGPGVRAQYTREHTKPDNPPPCSPKVIYFLARSLEIKTLRDLAFNDIRSKVTSKNVATELFSSFASRESDIMKMHCEMLGGKFPEESTTASVAEFIKSAAGGTASHRAGALKLALRNGRSVGSVPLPSRVMVQEPEPPFDTEEYETEEIWLN